jgi:hypothetical protein
MYASDPESERVIRSHVFEMVGRASGIVGTIDFSGRGSFPRWAIRWVQNGDGARLERMPRDKAADAFGVIGSRLPCRHGLSEKA